MHITLAENKKEWNEFVLRHSDAEFLQSWEWGDFQKSYGRRIWRFIIKKGDVTIAQSMTVCVRLARRFSYVYVPRGPVWSDVTEDHIKDEVYSLLMQNWRLIALESNAIFISIEPPLKKKDPALLKNITTFLRERNWKKTKSIQPQHTRILSLAIPLDEMLKKMSQKTRYNIRLSEKKELTVETIENEKDLVIFWKLLTETAQRDGIAIYDYSYFRKLFHILGDSTSRPHRSKLSSRLWCVYQDTTPVAAALVMLFGHAMHYLYGASSNRFRNLMPNHLMHWEIIKWGKERGYTMYDMWGVAPLGGKQHHPWAGVTRFKEGFGGIEYTYPGTFTYQYRPTLYRAYVLARMTKRMLWR